MSEEAQQLVKLEENIPVTVKVESAHWTVRELKDPETGKPTKKNALVLVITHVNGVPGSYVLSFLSRKAQETLKPMVESGSIMKYLLTVTKRGRGFFTEYEFSQK